MSDSLRSVPQEQLPSEDLHLAPMPVINLGHLILDPAARSRVVKHIVKACRHLGYFQVINHGISQSVMDGAVEAASEFFKLPSEIKEEFASDDFRQPIRYDTSSKDGISMSRAFLKHYAHPLSEWVQFWPKEPPIYREQMANYAVEVRRVALQLMEAILEGLGLGKDYLHEKFEEGLQLLSVNCYPEKSEGHTAIGLAPHSDYGFLTILLTSCQGLEVVDRNSNSWKVVHQLPHALHVHIGDHMEVLSNGQVKTVVHRAVLNPEEARISVASIHGFAFHEKVSSAKELRNGSERDEWPLGVANGENCFRWTEEEGELSRLVLQMEGEPRDGIPMLFRRRASGLPAFACAGQGGRGNGRWPPAGGV